MKKLINKLGAWLRKTFADPAKLQSDAKKIVFCLRYIKLAADSPAAASLVALIPGQFDDKILKAVQTSLARLLAIVDAVEKLPSGLPKDTAAQNAIIHKTGSMALSQLHNLPESEADYIIQRKYNELKFG